MAKHMTKAMKAIEPVDPEDLVFANGVTSICDMLGMLIGDPGDGVLLGRPIYQAFQADFGLKAKYASTSKALHVLTDADWLQAQISLCTIRRYRPVCS